MDRSLEADITVSSQFSRIGSEKQPHSGELGLVDFDRVDWTEPMRKSFQGIQVPVNASGASTGTSDEMLSGRFLPRSSTAGMETK